MNIADLLPADPAGQGRVYAAELTAQAATLKAKGLALQAEANEPGLSVATRGAKHRKAKALLAKARVAENAARITELLATLKPGDTITWTVPKGDV